MAYRLLGTGTTNANGQATYTYTGVGAGEIDVIASLDNPITQGSLVSQPTTVLDALFYDSGIKDDPQQNNKWLNQGNYFTIDVGTNGTTITEPSTGQGSSNFCPATEQTIYWNNRIILTAPTCIEFELTNVFDLSLRLNANGTSYSRSLSESGRYKVKINLENVEMWINDVKQSDLTSNSIDFTQSCNFSFIGSNNANIGTLTFKDYKMYLI